MSDDMVKYPRLTDLERKARRRIPHFIFEYLDAGTGRDFAKDANEAAYRELNLTPQFLRGRIFSAHSLELQVRGSLLLRLLRKSVAPRHAAGADCGRAG